MKKTDHYKIGIFDDYNCRFLIADCTNSISEAILRHNLEHSSAELVSKVMLSSFFLACMVKEGVAVNIQLEGQGDIERVIGYSDRIGRMRGLAKYTHIQADKNDITKGIGKGIFRVTRWGGPKQLHQSITKMDEIPFEQNLLNYINESEQLMSFLSIYISDSEPFKACGMILQALPFTEQKIMDLLMDKISELDVEISELFSDSIDSSLTRIESTLETKATILEEGIPEFYCGCSIEKIKNVIISIGKEEAFSIIQEQGFIEMTCEFCNEKYKLDPEEVQLLFL
jgi:molecular chaperone Hsp33